MSTITWTRPPRGENLMALDRRLPSSWCRRVGSPKIGDLGARLDGQHDAGHRGRGLDGVHRLFGQVVEVQLGEGDPQPAPGAGVGQEVLGHPLELLGVALDGLRACASGSR